MTKKTDKKIKTEVENLNSDLDLNIVLGIFLTCNVDASYDPCKRVEPNVIRYVNTINEFEVVIKWKMTMILIKKELENRKKKTILQLTIL